MRLKRWSFMIFHSWMSVRLRPDESKNLAWRRQLRPTFVHLYRFRQQLGCTVRKWESGKAFFYWFLVVWRSDYCMIGKSIFSQLYGVSIRRDSCELMTNGIGKREERNQRWIERRTLWVKERREEAFSEKRSISIEEYEDDERNCWVKKHLYIHYWTRGSFCCNVTLLRSLSLSLLFLLVFFVSENYEFLSTTHSLISSEERLYWKILHLLYFRLKREREREAWEKTTNTHTPKHTQTCTHWIHRPFPLSNSKTRRHTRARSTLLCPKSSAVSDVLWLECSSVMESGGLSGLGKPKMSTLLHLMLEWKRINFTLTDRKHDELRVWQKKTYPSIFIPLWLWL